MLLKVGERDPVVQEPVFLAPGSFVIGSVRLAAGASVWFNAVIRADSETIEVGPDSNIQDNVVLHADPGFPCRIGAGVTVGHGAVVHGATVEDNVLIGIGAVVLNGARIGAGSLVAAGAVIPEGREIPPGSLVAGVPGRVVRSLTEEERAAIRASAREYRERWETGGWAVR
ncbi:Gamma carbonic anhydrase family protein [Candidatus Hydrogenisulfobacillus filiaventi]|uniref:Gamma carbonic anhydrase family protein n=1 Tax=Candidatus Hydrogenisulfobacillus filiaventi TaxID=2707344 RepID=A0A6F8ZHL5_9FIRM|nr:gamma carbonic anhydrase family protein [Bacillota bacterium]CAB1129276.1 Gamma carbonic anhydrase family protein [Candidatus Hydrogenisulfobacillus filiaventi]